MACLKALDDVHRLDEVSWERLARICYHATTVWGPEGYISSPVSLRGWTKAKDMKTWEKIERQIATSPAGKPSMPPPPTSPPKPKLLVINPQWGWPYTYAPERRHEIKLRWPDATEDPDQGQPFTLTAEYLAEPDTYDSLAPAEILRRKKAADIED